VYVAGVKIAVQEVMLKDHLEHEPAADVCKQTNNRSTWQTYRELSNLSLHVQTEAPIVGRWRGVRGDGEV
jgi:hypothetical protein